MKYNKDMSVSYFNGRMLRGRKLFCGQVACLYLRYFNRHIIREKITPGKRFREEWKLVFRKNYTRWGKGEV